MCNLPVFKSVITQYDSTVYIGNAMGGGVRKYTFSFNLNLSSKDIEVENM